MAIFESPIVEATTSAELLTDEQAAAIAGVEPRTIRLWRHNRGLPFLRLTSKVVRIRRTDLNAWMNGFRTVIAA